MYFPLSLYNPNITQLQWPCSALDVWAAPQPAKFQIRRMVAFPRKVDGSICEITDESGNLRAESRGSIWQSTFEFNPQRRDNNPVLDFISLG